ncbi:Tudor domain-containing protein 3 [Sciurus carolinensis]|uniref:Tudor domain-containing protein 3 n=1 Tax=Sciurus carolinensis TaxID=30640 RepID=A0AA41MWM3_SCICA|nr:Tudor domain-containing protein 3 [Sciurus carolinensis]
MAEVPSAALSQAGWYLSDEGIEACISSPDKVNINDIILIALNTDLRTIGKKFLPGDINGGKVEKLKGPCVLQIQKICVSHVQVHSRELDRRKTLQVIMPVKPTNDNDEFEKQRTSAIAEVAKSKETKIFGGGGVSARSNLNMSAVGTEQKLKPSILLV